MMGDILLNKVLKHIFYLTLDLKCSSAISTYQLLDII